jgi:hypothetical protein
MQFFSYFDHGKLGAWAGPKHWKFKPLARLAAPEPADKAARGKKKKVSRAACTRTKSSFIQFEEDL